MRIGIHYASFGHPDWQHRLVERLTATARAADQGGASLFTVMDHYFQMEQLGGPSEPMLEGYTTLGYVAAQTERVRLGLLVTGATYRHPGLLAKIVTTVDVLSGGRAMLSLGAAWYDREHAGLGVPFVDTSRARLEGWCFVDRAHMTDRGYDAAAEMLEEVVPHADRQVDP